MLAAGLFHCCCGCQGLLQCRSECLQKSTCKRRGEDRRRLRRCYRRPEKIEKEKDRSALLRIELPSCGACMSTPYAYTFQSEHSTCLSAYQSETCCQWYLQNKTTIKRAKPAWVTKTTLWSLIMIINLSKILAFFGQTLSHSNVSECVVPPCGSKAKHCFPISQAALWSGVGCFWSHFSTLGLSPEKQSVVSFGPPISGELLFLKTQTSWNQNCVFVLKTFAKICTVSYCLHLPEFVKAAQVPFGAAGERCRAAKAWEMACARCADSLGFLLREIMVDLDLANLFSKAFEHQVRAPIYSFKILATGQENARKVGQLYVCQTLFSLRTCSCNRCMTYNLLSSWSFLTKVDKGNVPQAVRGVVHSPICSNKITSGLLSLAYTFLWCAYGNMIWLWIWVLWLRYRWPCLYYIFIWYVQYI